MLDAQFPSNHCAQSQQAEAAGVTAVLDLVVRKRRDTTAALRLLRRLLRNQRQPETVTTDGLASYGSAPNLLSLGNVHRPGRLRENNRAEISHLPIR